MWYITIHIVIEMNLRKKCVRFPRNCYTKLNHFSKTGLSAIYGWRGHSLGGWQRLCTLRNDGCTTFWNAPGQYILAKVSKFRFDFKHFYHLVHNMSTTNLEFWIDPFFSPFFFFFLYCVDFTSCNGVIKGFFRWDKAYMVGIIGPSGCNRVIRYLKSEYLGKTAILPVLPLIMPWYGMISY